MTWYDEMLKQREEGQDEALVKSIHAIMETAKVPVEKAMEMLKIDKSQWKKYMAML